MPGYMPSDKEMLDKGNGLLKRAEEILENPNLKDPLYAQPLPELECLYKALEMAEEGYGIIAKYRPTAETMITIVDKLKNRIKELKYPSPPSKSIKATSINVPLKTKKSKKVK